MNFTQETPVKKATKGGGIIQTIGLLGIIFCIVNLFAKFTLPVSAWTIFGVSVVLFLVGMFMGTTATSVKEVTDESISSN